MYGISHGIFEIVVLYNSCEIYRRYFVQLFDQLFLCCFLWFIFFHILHSFIIYVIHILLQLIIVNLCHTSWWFNHKIHKVYVIFIHVYLIASRHVLLALLYACRQVHSQFKLFVICTDSPWIYCEFFFQPVFGELCSKTMKFASYEFFLC